MAEVTQYVFSYQEVVETLIKRQGLNEGYWALYVEFGMGAGNVQISAKGEVAPAAVLTINKVGLQRVRELSNIALDASVVNPKR